MSEASPDPVSSQKNTNVRANFLPLMLRPIFKGLSQLSPRAATTLAHKIFLTPIRHRCPEREAWWATEAEPFEITFGKGKLAAWRWGWSGPTVLLVHGWEGRGLQLGAWAEPLVAKGFQVVAFDGPGHGRSTGNRSSMPEMASAVAAVVHHCGGVHAVVAHSFGAAATSVALASSRPRPRIERLVYIAPAVDILGATERFAHLTGFSTEVVAQMRRDLEQRFAIRWSDFQGASLASSMEQPLLVVHDQDDREIPSTDGEQLSRAWPGARFVATRGLGHRRVLRDSSVVALTTEFVAGGARAEFVAGGARAEVARVESARGRR